MSQAGTYGSYHEAALHAASQYIIPLMETTGLAETLPMTSAVPWELLFALHAENCRYHCFPFTNLVRVELQHEAGRALKLFAAESNDGSTAGTKTMDGLVTTSDIAALADVGTQAVYNELSKSGKEGASPTAAEPGRGRRQNRYRYSEALPWLRGTWPAKDFPDSFEEATAIVRRKASQSSVSCAASNGTIS